MEDKQPSSEPRNVNTYRPMRTKKPVESLALPESVSRSWAWGRSDREKGTELEEREGGVTGFSRGDLPSTSGGTTKEQAELGQQGG